MLPRAIQRFIDSFSKLPSVGPRLAQRLAFYLIGLDGQEFENIKNGIVGLGAIDRCPRCFFIKDKSDPLCRICADKNRDATTIAIVEKENDILSIEKTGVFNGTYLVLGESSGRGSLTSSQKLRLKSLKRHIKNNLGGKAKEIIIATSLTAIGDFLAQVVTKELKDNSGNITRLGRGIPTGGEIEFADEETLSSALERRN